MKKYFFALVCAIFFASNGFSQNPTPAPSPPVAETEDVVKISTTLIQVDATVTDSKGSVVTDLKAEDFEIYENGKKQTVSNLSFISNTKAKEEMPAEKNKPTVVPSPLQIQPEQVRRTIALVVDDLTLSFESIYQVRRALKKFVDEQMQDGDLVAIIRTGAGIGALQQFTTDRRQLYAAIEKVKWNPLGGGGIGAFAPIEATPLEQAKANGAQISDEQLKAEKDFTGGAEDFRQDVFATGTLGAISYIVRGMENLPGRKSIMLLSDGFSLFTRNSDGFSDSTRVLETLRRLVDAANRASVVVYTMDARGLQTVGFTAQDDAADLSSDAVEARLNDRKNQLFDTQEGLTYLARQTGGTSIINNNDLSGGIRKILDDQSYYLIGYQPEDETFDPKTRRFNKLEIKVKRPGLRVRYRSGFFGVTDEQMAQKPAANLTPAQQIQNALTSPFAVNDVSLRLNALFNNDAKQGSFVRSLLHVNAQNLKFTDEANGAKKTIFDVLAVAFGDNGLVIDQIAKTYTLTVNKEIYEQFLKDGFVYDFSFPIKKAGAYQLRVALRDAGNGKVGSANQFVEIPNLKKERLTLSSIGLQNMSFADWEKVNAGQDLSEEAQAKMNPLSDTALRQFKRGTVLSYGMQVLNAKLDAARKPNLSYQTVIIRDGKKIFEGKPQPMDTGNISDPQRIGMSSALNLGTSMQPGEYVLQIIITDNLAKENRKIAAQFVTFEIIQ